MGLSSRVFLLDQHDSIYRLPITTFERMLGDESACRFPRFAGTRVRQTGVVVELVDRQPLHVVWTSYSILAFDADGRLDASAFERQQRARAELSLAPLQPEADGSATVVDSASRFINRGGQWAPSRALAHRLEEAALGRLKCLRL